jgi:hypothetical protein
MTAAPVLRSLPDSATGAVSVVEVYGSMFLLEWLDRDVLASASGLRLREAGTPPVRSSGG